MSIEFDSDTYRISWTCPFCGNQNDDQAESLEEDGGSEILQCTDCEAEVIIEIDGETTFQLIDIRFADDVMKRIADGEGKPPKPYIDPNQVLLFPELKPEE